MIYYYIYDIILTFDVTVCMLRGWEEGTCGGRGGGSWEHRIRRRECIECMDCHCCPDYNVHIEFVTSSGDFFNCTSATIVSLALLPLNVVLVIAQPLLSLSSLGIFLSRLLVQFHEVEV